jgi:ABC-type lipoprotein release transport system permease subunit
MHNNYAYHTFALSFITLGLALGLAGLGLGVVLSTLMSTLVLLTPIRTSLYRSTMPLPLPLATTTTYLWVLHSTCSSTR